MTDRPATPQDKAVIPTLLRDEWRRFEQIERLERIRIETERMLARRRDVLP